MSCLFRKDRHPPRGVSCPFRIAVTFDKFRPADQQTWQVTELVLEHRNHNPQPGEYKPHSRKFQKGLAARSLLASSLERGQGPRAVQQGPSSQSSRPARLLPSSGIQTRSHSIDFQQASPSAIHLSRLIVKTGNEGGRAESGRSKRKRESSESENRNVKIRQR
ncbi:hypothetical protein CROQUDRAFT_144839 [Cronartium quercuum f. sp. fusiforme G11]|uniref:Uncharacterized protein n=1 Tax=Cronartium quercuum f. sp. fusiforme G11 TaxID=708437 RepID=A0A9P6NXX8_9BASI|nr:hypothetical protein CROQUDRAFT_144839 [Cronartium quercuum f. sp. fusiforme G11]